MQKQVVKLDVTPEQGRIVRDILETYVPNYEVWAFGSRVTGTAKPYSDLDLVVVTKEPLPLEQSANLTDAFSESDLPWKVDVVDWARASDKFRDIIRRQHVVVWKPDSRV